MRIRFYNFSTIYSSQFNIPTIKKVNFKMLSPANGRTKVKPPSKYQVMLSWLIGPLYT